MNNHSTTLVLAGIVLIQLGILLPYVSTEVFNIDETIFAVSAKEILAGKLLYTDIWDIKPPGIFFVYAVVFKFLGSSITYIHGLTVVWRCLTTLGVYLVGSRLYSRELGSGAAFLFAIFSSTYLHSDFMASNTETFFLLPVVYGFFIFLSGKDSASHKKRLCCYLVTGALMGIGFGFKQPVLYELMVPIIYLATRRLISDQTNNIGKSDLVLAMTVIIGGFLASLLPYIIYFYVRRGISQLVFLTWTYNFLYLESINFTDFIKNMIAGTIRVVIPNIIFWGIGFVTYLILFFRKGLILKRVSGIHHNSILFMIIWFIFSCLGVGSGRRFVGHYYIQLLPVISILAAGGWFFLFRTAWIKGRVFFIFLVFIFMAGIIYPLERYHGIFQGIWLKSITGEIRLESPELVFFRDVSDYVRSNSTDDDTIFVWGFAPQIYYLAGRNPASRFLHCGYYTGATAFDSDLNKGPQATKRRIIPGTLQTLLEELKYYNPVFILDTTSTNRLGFGKFGISNYPSIFHFVRTHYKFFIDLEGIRIYKRIQ